MFIVVQVLKRLIATSKSPTLKAECVEKLTLLLVKVTERYILHVGFVQSCHLND